jgi:hypothetical protein
MSAAEVLESYDPKHLKCRTLGHDPKFFYRVIRKDHTGRALVKERLELCKRCTRKRWFLINAESRKITGSEGTWYPPGYGTPKTGLRKPDFSAIEYENDFRRALKEGRVMLDDANTVTGLAG